MGSKPLLGYVNRLARRRKRPIEIQIDIKFNMASKYLTTFLVRLDAFNECPYIPIAFALHDRRTARTIQAFYEEISRRCDFRNNYLIFIVGREAALVKTLTSSFPNARVFICWRHINTDIKHYLKTKVKCEATDRNYCINLIRAMLNSSSEVSYDRRVEDFNNDVNIPLEFRTYCTEPNLLADVRKSAKFEVLASDLTDTYKDNITTLVSTNAVEGFNSQFSRQCGDEMFIDTLLIKLYRLQTMYEVLLAKGTMDQGRLHLAASYLSWKVKYNPNALPKAITKADLAAKVSNAMKFRGD